jgi:hypothetical protein
MQPLGLSGDAQTWAPREFRADNTPPLCRLLHSERARSFGSIVFPDVNQNGFQGWGVEIVARKKRVKKFRAVEAVKALARERIGSPPPTQVVPNKRKPGKQEKHKPTLSGLLAEE